MSETLLVDEPVHVYEHPSSLQASAAPFWVGVKNTFVVTWLTIVKWYDALVPKIAAAPPLAAADALEVDLLLPHASRINAATPAAPPVSAVRRVD
jgi:hypothetical protein